MRWFKRAGPSTVFTRITCHMDGKAEDEGQEGPGQEPSSSTTDRVFSRPAGGARGSDVQPAAVANGQECFQGGEDERNPRGIEAVLCGQEGYRQGRDGNPFIERTTAPADAFVFSLEYRRAPPATRQAWAVGQSFGSPGLPPVPARPATQTREAAPPPPSPDGADQDLVLMDVEEGDEGVAESGAATRAGEKEADSKTLKLLEKKKQWRAGVSVSDKSGAAGSQHLVSAIRSIKMRKMIGRMNQYDVTDTQQGLANKTFFVFGRQSAVWRIFDFIHRSLLFRWTLHLSVVASSIATIITPPHGHLSVPSPLYVLSQPQLELLELIFNVIFSVEMLVLIMVRGLFVGEHAYLRDGWHRLDAAIVTLTWIDFSGLLEGYQGARTLRLMRVLKPLRVIKRNQGAWGAVLIALMFWVKSLGFRGYQRRRE